MNIENGYGVGNQWSSTVGFNRYADKNKSRLGNKTTWGRQGGKVTVKKTNKSSNYMMRIAQARTVSQVAAIIRIARGDMQFVKKCNSEERDIAKAMRILKQVVAKSKVKIQKLKAEEELEKKEKIARSRGKKKLEKETKEKRYKKKKARTAKEAADTLNTEEVTVSKTTYVEDMDIGIAVNGTASGGVVSADMAISSETASAGSSIEAVL